jgi:hypothetical protein
MTAFAPTLAIRLADVPTTSMSKSFFIKRSVQVCSRESTALHIGEIDSILRVTMPPHTSVQKKSTLEKHSHKDIFLMITI